MRHRTAHALVIAALLTPAAAVASWFHVALKKSDPAKGTSVATAPAALRFWFTEPPEVTLTRVSLLTAAGDAVALGKVAEDTSAGRPVVVPITRHLGPGAYTVKWYTMSRDGHPVRGTFGFTVAR